MVLGALEHQMFEEMRDAGLAGSLVGGADPAASRATFDAQRAVPQAPG